MNRMLPSTVWMLFLWFLACEVQGTPLDVRFATPTEGRRKLRKRDEFIARLSPFDRSARLKTDGPVSEKRYLDFVAAQVKPWDRESREAVSAALALVRPKLEEMKLPWPRVIWLIRTTGEEEGKAAYTRGSSIVLPDARLVRDSGRLADLLAHELFHVLSRANPTLRAELYRAIGFEKCPEVAFPPGLAARRITNPDAPVFDQAITVMAGGSRRRVVPVLHATVDRYPAGEKREFFEFLAFRFWPLDAPKSPADGLPVLLTEAEISGFSEQVGRNTGYIIHPEEILADNFKFLVRAATNVASPEVLERVARLLARPPASQ